MSVDVPYSLDEVPQRKANRETKTALWLNDFPYVNKLEIFLAERGERVNIRLGLQSSESLLRCRGDDPAPSAVLGSFK